MIRRPLAPAGVPDTPPSDDSLERLYRAATDVIDDPDDRSAPYSGYHVGAALWTTDERASTDGPGRRTPPDGGPGAVYLGRNFEVVNFNNTLHAEQVALAAARSDGVAPGSFEAIAVSTAAGDSPPPCGMCRQLLADNAPGDLTVVVDAYTDETATEPGTHQLADLTPDYPSERRGAAESPATPEVPDGADRTVETAVAMHGRSEAADPVGAAVRTADGTVHGGARVDGASPVSAVDAAVGRALLADTGTIEAVATAGATPTGGDRQLLAEYAPADTPVVVVDDGVTRTPLGELLPAVFEGESLDTGETDEREAAGADRSEDEDPADRGR